MTDYYNDFNRGVYWTTAWYSSSNAWYLSFTSVDLYIYNDYNRYGLSLVAIKS